MTPTAQMVGTRKRRPRRPHIDKYAHIPRVQPIGLPRECFTATHRPKVGYPSQRQANKALAASIERSPELRPTLNVYLCSRCSLWHIGRLKQSEVAA